MDWSPLMKAVRSGKLEETRQLLENGSDPRELNPFGVDLMTLACASGNEDVVKVVYRELEAASMDGLPNLGSALHTAVLFDYESIVKYVIGQKCDLNAKDKDSGVTALMLATCIGSARLVRLLLSYRADPSVTNELQQTALDIALTKQHQDIVLLLQEHTRNKRILLGPHRRMLDRSKITTERSLPRITSPKVRHQCQHHSFNSLLRVTPHVSQSPCSGIQKIPKIVHTDFSDINLGDCESFSTPPEPLRIANVSTPVPYHHGMVFSSPISPIKFQTPQDTSCRANDGHFTLMQHHRNLEMGAKELSQYLAPSNNSDRSSPQAGSYYRRQQKGLRRQETDECGDCNESASQSHLLYHSLPNKSSPGCGGRSCDYSGGGDSGSEHYFTGTSCVCLAGDFHQPFVKGTSDLTFKEKLYLLDNISSEGRYQSPHALSESRKKRNLKLVCRLLSKRLQVKGKRRNGYALHHLSLACLEKAGSSNKSERKVKSNNVRKLFPKFFNVCNSASDPGLCDSSQDRRISNKRLSTSPYSNTEDMQVSASDDDAAGPWNVPDILCMNGLGHYVTLFEEHEIDFSIFSAMTEADLIEMGIKNQLHRHTVLEIAKEIKARCVHY